MGLIPQATKERIRERTDMVQLVQQYVPALQQRNPDDFWACCPFPGHDEDTPSFHILPSKGLFKCFGCGKGGDVFKFVEEVEGLSFPQALRLLAQKAGISVEAATPAERAREARQRELARTSQLAAEFYETTLWSNTAAGERGRAYLAQRGIGEETARAFRLGIAPDEWGALVQHGQQREIPPRALVELGLAREGRNGRLYDFFRDRLVFPIADEQGRIVAFGGRVIPGESKTAKPDAPKYLNSPEIEGLYSKRRHLYGLDKAKATAVKGRRLVVCEGYMDVVMPHQFGRGEFVASLGTAFTPEQAKLARRYADEVVLLFDGDEAGQQATLRALATLVGVEKLTVKVTCLPGGQDPDEILRQDPAALDRALDEAEDVVNFLVNAALAGRDVSSPAGRALAIRATLKLLAQIKDDIRLYAELGNVARRFGLPEETLRQELLRAREEQQAPKRGKAARQRQFSHDSERRPGPPPRPSPGPNVIPGKELRLLEAILAAPEAAQPLLLEGQADPQAFSPGPARLIAGAILAEAREHGQIEPSRVLGRIDDPISRDVVGELLGKLDSEGHKIGHKADYAGELAGLSRLFKEAEERKLRELRNAIRRAPDQQTKDALLAELARRRAGPDQESQGPNEERAAG